MVLDVKAMTWAAQNDIDTAKLKAAKVPIYGKWYFPEIPANVLVVNLETGERRTFPQRMLAGELVWVAEADLRRAGLGPFRPAGDSTSAPPATPASSAAAAPPTAAASAPPASAPAEPLIAVSRAAVAAPAEATPQLVPTVADTPQEAGSIPPGVHLPLPSMAPFILGVGLAIVLLGLITHPAVLVVGLVWVLVGAIGWIRIGLLEAHDAEGHHPHA